MSSSKVSIIVPIYNVEDYIEECLESIVRQTYHNIEIICVNDATKDDSMSIVKKFSQKDKRFVLLEHSCNKGLSAARNTGMKVATGKYMLFVDADDIIDLNMVDIMTRYMEGYMLEVLYGSMKRFWDNAIESPDEKQLFEFDEDKVYSGKEWFCLMTEKNDLHGEVCGCMYLTSFLKCHKLAFIESIVYEDNVFSFKVFMFAKRVMKLNKKLYLYRQRSGSIMHGGIHSELALHSKLYLLSELFTTWKQGQFDDRENKAIGKYFSRQYKDFIGRVRETPVSGKSDFPYIPERTLLDLIRRQDEIRVYVQLDETMIEQARLHKKVYVYGAGKAAEEIVNQLKQNAINIDKIILTNKMTKDTFMEIKVVQVSELNESEDDILVILGATRKYRDEMRHNLEQKRIYHIIDPIDL